MNDGIRVEARLAALEAEVAALRAGPAGTLSQHRVHGPRRTLRGRVATALLAIVLVAVPSIALASDSFADVPDGNPFHSAINAIFGARITTGCGGGNYCPSEPVTREQMAAFMQRGFGRAVSGGTGPATLTWDDFADGVAGTVTLRTGGTPGGYGLVLVTADASAWTTSETACPCQITAWLGTSASDERSGSVNHNFGNIQGGTPMTTLATSHVFVVPTAATVSFVLGGEIEGPNFPLAPEVSTFLRWNMSAVYVPFDAEGANPTPFAPTP